ncbi:hypothetical protein [Mesorhizobium amorphae]
MKKKPAPAGFFHFHEGKRAIFVAQRRSVLKTPEESTLFSLYIDKLDSILCSCVLVECFAMICAQTAGKRLTGLRLRQ